jgi:hypothetical protein
VRQEDSKFKDRLVYNEFKASRLYSKILSQKKTNQPNKKTLKRVKGILSLRKSEHYCIE